LGGERKETEKVGGKIEKKPGKKAREKGGKSLTRSDVQVRKKKSLEHHQTRGGKQPKKRKVF